MYGKLFAQMYDGTLGTNGPWQALITFQQLIILADKDGVVDMTPEALSRRTTVPLDIIQTGLTALGQPDPDSRTPDEEGRRIVSLNEGRAWGWRIVNYAKYREMRTAEERRAYHRKYWREKRSPKISTDSTETQQTQPIVEVEVEAKAEAGNNASGVDLFVDRLPENSRETVRQMANAQRNPVAWVASMVAMLDGMHGTPLPAAELAVALTELAATDARPSPATVRAFVRRGRKDGEVVGSRPARNARNLEVLAEYRAQRGANGQS